MEGQKMNPFNHHYFIGYISQVTPQYISVHFPSSVLLNKFVFGGEEFSGGLVGNFIVIEGENHGFIGQLQEIQLPEKERLSLSDSAFRNESFHPTAKAEILLAFNLFDHHEVSKGSNCFPNIGAKVFVCPQEFMYKYITGFGVKDKNEFQLRIGALNLNSKSKVIISQQAFFSRHCAVVGTTGGGKSWTISKLIEQVQSNGTKCILIDPTGEYSPLMGLKNAVNCTLSQTHCFNYRKLTVNDLFFLLKPGEKVQSPKLMEAIRSLKAIEFAKNNGINDIDSYLDPQKNTVIKNGNNKKAWLTFTRTNIKAIESVNLDFDIQHLSEQIYNECVWDIGRNSNGASDSKFWGGIADNDWSNCVSLITRLKSLLNSEMYNSILAFDSSTALRDLADEISTFATKDNPNTLLRIGFGCAGYDFNIREIIANAIAIYLLGMARKGVFKKIPLILMVDEAHQFLNKQVSDDSFATLSLNAFDQIAKECRKYGLFLCIATQMPRDIPIGTLSQMGTFLVHRLINYYDKEAIRQSCGTANNNTLSYLPILGQGEAILTGVDFPMPLLIKVDRPDIPPDSATPLFHQ